MTRRPWDLLLLVTAGLLLIAQARTHVFIPGVAQVRPALLLMAIGLGLWMIQKDRMRSWKRLRRDSTSRFALLFAIWAGLTVPFAYYKGGALSYYLEGFISTIVIFGLIALAIRSLEDVRRLVGVVAIGAGVYAVMAPVGGAIRGMSAGGYDPNDAGMYLASSLPALVFFVLYGRTVLTRVLAGAGVVACMFAIVDTGSRGGFLALVCVLAFMVLMLRGVKPALRVGVVAVVFLVSIPVASSEYWDRMETILEFDDGYGEAGELYGRWNIWERGVGYWLDNPITGVGINNFPVAEARHPAISARIEGGRGFAYRTAHSMWVLVLAELGTVGIVLFVLMFYHTFRNLRRIQRMRWHPPPPFRRRELQVLTGILLASMVGLMVGGSILSQSYSVMVWGILGIAVGLVKVLEVNTNGKNTHRMDGGQGACVASRSDTKALRDRSPVG